MSTTTTKAQRLPRTTQGVDLVPAIAIEISFDGTVLGSIEAPQEDFLSKGGNVLYNGRISRGWMLPGTPEEALNALSFKANGVEMKRSEKGVNLTAPRTDRNGKVIPNSGGELLVSHSTILNCSTVEGEVAEFMVNVHAKKIKALRKGEDQGFQLRVQGFPKGVGRVGGPQIVGSFDGLTVITQP
jgi:hypothetical protein